MKPNPQLIVDLEQLANNYKNLLQYEKEIISVVKSNAYGFGLFEISRVLFDLGCRVFAVAWPNDGVLLRNYLGKDVEIIVLHGLIDSIETYISFDLAPAILSMEHFYNLSNQIKYWLHFDTGINRTGISKNNLSEIKNKICEKKYGNLIGAMSHLATSVVDHENKTKYQIETAKEIFVNFNCRTSMMKTLGLINEEVSCFDLIRPGHGLYFHMHEKVPTKDIGTLKSTILQIKNIKKGETVGYDCTYEAKENIIIAMINGGYANGISLKHPYVLINSKQYPVVGKVSMDMITVQIDEDVSLTDEVIILQDNWIEISSFIGQSPGSLSSVLNVNRIYV